MRKRIIAARILVVLGAIIAALAAVAGYVRYQVFDDSTFRGTAQDLIADPVVRDQVAQSLVEQLYANVDVAARLEQRLPADQKGLAVPIAAALRSLADSQAQRLLGRPRVQDLWVNTASRAQRQLERVLDDKARLFETRGGYIVLDLTPIVDRLGDRVAIAAKIPADRAEIRIMKADQLEKAQDVTKLFKKVAPWLWVIPLVLWALAIWLARGRRREEVRAVAIAFIVTGLLILILRTVGGRYVVDSLAKTESVKPAAQHAWDIITALLVDGGRTLVGVGVVALLGTWLVGPGARAAEARRRLAPVLDRWEYAYGLGALLLLLVVWWGPTAQTRRLGWIVVVAILLGVGIEVLRRTAARTRTG